MSGLPAPLPRPGSVTRYAAPPASRRAEAFGFSARRARRVVRSARLLSPAGECYF
jgi:hypothetical protein